MTSCSSRSQCRASAARSASPPAPRRQLERLDADELRVGCDQDHPGDILDDVKHRELRHVHVLPTSSCTGTPVPAAASAVATTYTGVNVALTPTITSGGNSSGTALTAPQNPTTTGYEQVVNLFATSDAFSGATPGVPSQAQTSPSSVWANIGESAGPQQATGNQAPQATATSANSATWTAQTVDLVPLLSSTITVTPPTGYEGAAQI